MSRISKANICGYRGSEIPESAALGLDPNKIYRLLRDPHELEKAASTFDGKPLLIRHVPVTAEQPAQNLWVGTLGKCTFEAPYLVARPLTVITAEAQSLIESDEQRELSAGYRYRAEMIPGVYDGEKYDGRMVDIQGNHVALVRDGRAGPDVLVADESPPELTLMALKNSALIGRIKTIPALAAVLNTATLLALDAALGETPATSVIKLTQDEEKTACDAALDEKRKEHGKDAMLTEDEKAAALKKALDAKCAAAKDKKPTAAERRAAKKAAADAKRATDAAAAADAAADAADSAEAAADSEEEEEDEEEEAEDAEDSSREAMERRDARDERRRARDRRAGARDERKKARDARRGHDVAPVDHRDDFNSNRDRRGRANKSGKARAAADQVMSMDEVNELVEKRVAKERTSIRDEVSQQLRAIAVACDESQPITGALQIHAFDSAEEVYLHALDQTEVEVPDDLSLAGLRALVLAEVRHLQSKRPVRRQGGHAHDARQPAGYDPVALFQKAG